MHVRASSRDIGVPPNCLSGEVDGVRARDGCNTRAGVRSRVRARESDGARETNGREDKVGRGERGENRGAMEKGDKEQAERETRRRLGRGGLYVPHHRYT